MLYNIIKNLINHNYYEREDMTNKLNVFMLVNQITESQYLELLAMINPVEKKEDVKVDNVKEEKIVENESIETKTETNEDVVEDVVETKIEENNEEITQ
ncbi:hypothetical protein [Clostridium taeniosporum]|uniref:Uncharacterized protein n=1 Tax=Clostridium taeniosporum TaxID=394958 RepID=A0A1D7XLU1_9CLOT|nr:hypothetical protein [Clostridium taeniosporum]AOR24294.1 hypothetical protein BGI42_11350 [Clostridium taeniosporum]